MPVRQWLEIEPDNDEATCSSTGPEGWYCGLPEGHQGNHIGFTRRWGTISQWEADDASS